MHVVDCSHAVVISTVLELVCRVGFRRACTLQTFGIFNVITDVKGRGVKPLVFYITIASIENISSKELYQIIPINFKILPESLVET